MSAITRRSLRINAACIRLPVLMAAPLLTESRLVSDNTMPKQNWAAFDSPAKDRFVTTREKRIVKRRPQTILRQAS